MNLPTGISAFLSRSVRRAGAIQLLAYSGAATLLLLAAAWWICLHAEDPPGGSWIYEDQPGLPFVGWSTLGLADLFAVLLLGLGGFVVAPAAVAAQVAAERRAGTLEQLRLTPLSPLALASGLIVGAVGRMGLLLSGPLALHLLCGLTGVIPLPSLIAGVAVLVVGTGASLVFGLAAGLAPRQDSAVGLVAVAVALLLGAASFIGMLLAQEPNPAAWAFISPAGALHATMLQHEGLWRRLFVSAWRLHRFDDSSLYPDVLAVAPLLSVALSLIAGAVVAAACTRQLASPTRPFLSKAQSVILFALVTLAVVGPLHFAISGHRSAGIGALVSTMLLLPVAALLGLLAAPGADEWHLGLRADRRRSWLADHAAPHGSMWLMAGLLFAGLWTLPFRVRLLHENDLLAGAWAAWTALWLPAMVLFVATRYAAASARLAVGATLAVHLLGQGVAVTMLVDGPRHFATPYVEGAALLGLLVPCWIVWRQRRHDRAALSD